MRRPYSPTVRRRRLAKELRHLREEAGFTVTQAARETGTRQPTLTRIELGQQHVTAPVLERLLDLYGVTDQARREAFAQLARDAKERGWWAKYRDVFHGSLPDLESEAEVIRAFEAQVIPGLLQTPDYIEAIFRGGRAHEEAAVHKAVDARMKRQEILNRVHPPRFEAVIDEGALRRLIGGREVMREQLQRLVNMATRHNITIRVLPFDAGEHAAIAGAFTILDFPEAFDPSVVFTETPTDTLLVEEPPELDRYNEIFGHILGSALVPAKSVTFLKQVIEDLT
ncbi:Helix-turn-helix domain-containing protein [Marinactinospora thermotolerans DSM 45154]|uniref:Helix-turn-helix domain-containing protein n=1 Tax=Marinactinospora thermotolerans DSM 45154 TaxID=1122192 RepID=A0A1T4TFC3_9ACTN|nr:Helix-turn-helix domain-containing protein [Marinactinospora thermotolerans DSM 45154]